MSRARGQAERLADNVIHVIGVSGGIVAVAALLTAAFVWLPAYTTLSLAVYGLALVAMVSCSAAYNMATRLAWKRFLQRLDHAAIFLKIAGTYTPFTALIGGASATIVLVVVWVVALAGVAGKLLLPSTWDRVAIPMYLALGWVGIFIMGPLTASLSTLAVILLVAGGVLYSVGVLFHLWRSLPYQNAIWHAFVLIATGCHFAAISTAMFG